MIRQLQTNISTKTISTVTTGPNLTLGDTGHGVGTDTSNTGYHIVPNYPMYNNPNFCIVKNVTTDTVLDYNVDWVFGHSYRGCNSNDISHSIRLHNGLGQVDTFSCEYTENYSSYVPSLSLFRTDGADTNGKLIPSRMHYYDGYGSPCDDKDLILWEVSEVANFSYEAVYGEAIGPHTSPYSCEMRFDKIYGTHLKLKEFGEGETLPTGWRIEYYNFGAGGTNISRGGSIMNLNPMYITSNNIIDITNSNFTRGTYGVVRLRNTEKNILTQFAVRKLLVRKTHAVQHGNFGDNIIKQDIYISRLI